MKKVIGLIIIKNGQMLLTLSNNGVWTPLGENWKMGKRIKNVQREALEEMNSRISF
jgi:hypothetical protein